jgi:arsenite oxidase small subunit
MSETVSRRDFFKISGGVAAGVGLAVSGLAAHSAEAAVNTSANLPYRSKPIANVRTMKTNDPVLFAYPDAASPCLAVKTGNPVPGGIGPDKDIIAYSTQCTHHGCPVSYDPKEKSFKCPCHFSLFDAEKQGQVICGQAPTKLPQIVLEYDAKSGSIFAVSVIGLIYGRQANIL